MSPAVSSQRLEASKTASSGALLGGQPSGAGLSAFPRSAGAVLSRAATRWPSGDNATVAQSLLCRSSQASRFQELISQTATKPSPPVVALLANGGEGKTENDKAAVSQPGASILARGRVPDQRPDSSPARNRLPSGEKQPVEG